jgi:hypothetical protein
MINEPELRDAGLYKNDSGVLLYAEYSVTAPTWHWEVGEPVPPEAAADEWFWFENEADARKALMPE